MEDDGDDKDDSKRRTRNLSEKKRRDQFNTLVNELGMMVSSNNRKMDKSTVLKATISFLKNHNDITVRSRAHDVRGDWKPSFFPNDEFTYLVLEALEGFLMVISPSGRVHYVSESIASLLGHNPADILDQSIFELVREDDRSRLYAVLSMDTSMATKGHELSFQVHLRRGALDFRQEISYELVQFYGNFRINTEQSDGSDRSSCFQEHDSRVLFACAGCLQAPLLIRDVSLVDSNRCEFTSRHSLEWKFLFLDHRGPPIIGYLPFEVLGTSGYDYYHFDDLEKVVACHEALMEKGELTSCYYRFLTKGQQWIWLQTRFYITYHQWNSKPEFVVCAHRVVSYADVSNSVKSEVDQGDMRPKGGGHRQNAPSEGSRLVVHPPSEGSLVGGGPLSDSSRLGSALSEGSRLVVHAPSEGTRLGSGLSEGSRIVVDAVSEGSMRLVGAPTEGSGRVVNAPSEGSRLFVGVPSESVTTAALSPSCISEVSDAFANYRPRSQCASGTSVSVISAAGTVATVATVATATTGTSWGARGRYESRQGSDTDFERLQGSDTGFERRQESDTGFERRQGSDTGFERRQGSDTGFERRQGSDTGFERRQGSDTGFERRPGSDTGLERRQGSDTGLERRQGSDNGESRRNNEQERQNSYKESVTPLTPQHVMGAQYLEPSPFGSGPPTAVNALALLQPRPHCVDEHLHRKHDELQQMIVRQQAELQQVKEQLLLARLGILPPLVSVSVPLAQVQSPYVTMDDMQQPVPLMQAQIMYEPQPPITEYPGQYPPHPHQQ